MCQGVAWGVRGRKQAPSRSLGALAAHGGLARPNRISLRRVPMTLCAVTLSMVDDCPYTYSSSPGIQSQCPCQAQRSRPRPDLVQKRRSHIKSLSLAVSPTGRVFLLLLFSLSAVTSQCSRLACTAQIARAVPPSSLSPLRHGRAKYTYCYAAVRGPRLLRTYGRVNGAEQCHRA